MLFDGLVALELMPCFDRDLPAVGAVRAGTFTRKDWNLRQMEKNLLFRTTLNSFRQTFGFGSLFFSVITFFFFLLFFIFSL